MTAYNASATATGASLAAFGVAVKAATYPMRISKIEAYYQIATVGAQPALYTISNYAGATLSGGSVVTPFPLRGGVTAAAGSARGGSGTSVSGTSTFLTEFSAPVFTVSSYQFPFNYILNPGSAIFVTTGGSGGTPITWMLAVFYEELRRNWST